MSQIFQGFWDQVCSRKGWSNKISKWQWVSIQIIVPIIIVLPFISWMVVKFDDYTLKQAIIFTVIFFPIMALFNLGAWDKDQKQLNEERAD